MYVLVAAKISSRICSIERWIRKYKTINWVTHLDYKGVHENLNFQTVAVYNIQNSSQRYGMFGWALPTVDEGLQIFPNNCLQLRKSFAVAWKRLETSWRHVAISWRPKEWRKKILTHCQPLVRRNAVSNTSYLLGKDRARFAFSPCHQILMISLTHRSRFRSTHRFNYCSSVTLRFSVLQ